MTLCNTKLGFPIFDTCGLQDGTTFALCGGGGSAKSGLGNSLCLCKLGPRPDAKTPGVDVAVLSKLDTGDKISASCSLSSDDAWVAYELNGLLALAAVGKSGELKALELQPYKAAAPISTVQFVSWSASVVAIALANGDVELVECAASGFAHRGTLVGHTKPVTELDSLGGLLLSASADDVRVWNETSAPCLQMLPADLSSGLVIKKARVVGAHVILALQNSTARRGNSFLVAWKRPAADKPFELRKVVLCGKTSGTALGIDAHGDLVAVGDADSFVQLFSLGTLEPLRRVKQRLHSLPVTSVLFLKGPGQPRYMLTSSADATCAMLRLDALEGGDGCCSWVTLLVLAILAAGVAFAVGASPELRALCLEAAHRVDAVVQTYM